MKTSLTAFGTTRAVFLLFTACLLAAGALPRLAALGRSANCMVLLLFCRGTKEMQHVCCLTKVSWGGQWASNCCSRLMMVSKPGGFGWASQTHQTIYIHIIPSILLPYVTLTLSISVFPMLLLC